jgi:hypothetical protein
MLSEAVNADLYAEWLAHVASEEAKDAFRYLVGAAAGFKTLTCHIQYKGVIRDFRLLDSDGVQRFSFIANKKWLLFYFRTPIVRAGTYALDELQDALPLAKENNRNEWTVPLHNIGEVRALLEYLDIE